MGSIVKKRGKHGNLVGLLLLLSSFGLASCEDPKNNLESDFKAFSTEVIPELQQTIDDLHSEISSREDNLAELRVELDRLGLYQVYGENRKEYKDQDYQRWDITIGSMRSYREQLVDMRERLYLVFVKHQLFRGDITQGKLDKETKSATMLARKTKILLMAALKEFA